MRIVIFGIPYSANVGDGIIAECLAYGLRRARPDVELVHIDISGRNDFGDQILPHRALALRLLFSLPLALRQRLVIWRLGAILAALRPSWLEKTREADLAILGGGQLFSDANLNFCLKIGQVAEIVQQTKTPLAVFAVGVSKNWTEQGTALFRKIFAADLRFVGLRDQASIISWRDQNGIEGPEPKVTFDPGILAAQKYQTSVAPFHAVGLCITALKMLSWHVDSTVVGGRDGFFADLAAELVGKGRRVVLFCNGAEEDRAAMAQVAAHPKVAALIASGQVSVKPAPETAADLAMIIAGCEAVIAHRLHACIVGYAFRIPSIALGSDTKVKSFYSNVSLEDFFIGDASATAATVASRCEAAIATGVEPENHARIVALTQSHIASLYDLVSPDQK